MRSNENWILSCYEIWQIFTHQGLAFSPPGIQTHLSSTPLVWSYPNSTQLITTTLFYFLGILMIQILPSLPTLGVQFLRWDSQRKGPLARLKPFCEGEYETWTERSRSFCKVYIFRIAGRGNQASFKFNQWFLLSQVCTLEPLKVGAYPGHPLGHHSILALATISKVIVITVRWKNDGL